MENVRIANRYTLLNPIGSGGEARVFRARDETGGSDVAVRLALGNVHSVISAAPAFTNEHWVRFLDAGVDAQHGAYQIFELLDGRTLSEIVAAAPLQREAWRAFVDQALAAVKAVHLAGMAHGDLNADNFLCTEAGWKLLELPFYRFQAPPSRTTMFGSIYTLAPEQIDGAKASVRTDLYSLGCLYFYAASAKWPHSGDTVQEVAISCLMRAPIDLRAAAPDLPPSWCDWVMTLLARRAEERPSSVVAARQLLADAVA